MWNFRVQEYRWVSFSLAQADHFFANGRDIIGNKMNVIETNSAISVSKLIPVKELFKLAIMRAINDL